MTNSQNERRPGRAETIAAWITLISLLTWPATGLVFLLDILIGL